MKEIRDINAQSRKIAQAAAAHLSHKQDQRHGSNRKQIESNRRQPAALETPGGAFPSKNNR